MRRSSANACLLCTIVWAVYVVVLNGSENALAFAMTSFDCRAYVIFVDESGPSVQSNWSPGAISCRVGKRLGYL